MSTRESRDCHVSKLQLEPHGLGNEASESDYRSKKKCFDHLTAQLNPRIYYNKSTY